MTIEFVHILLATGVLLLWLLIVVETSPEEEGLSRSSSIGQKDKSAA
jgi:hypothetical protein